MSANGSTHGDVDDTANAAIEVDEDEEVDEADDVDPLLMSSIWDDVKIQKTLSEDGKRMWKCGYCNSSFSGHNATKAVAHVCRTKGQDIAPCRQFNFIPLKFRQSHQDLSDRKSVAKHKWQVMHETLDRSIDRVVARSVLHP
jgi:hypothetical protein